MVEVNQRNKTRAARLSSLTDFHRSDHSSCGIVQLTTAITSKVDVVSRRYTVSKNSRKTSRNNEFDFVSRLCYSLSSSCFRS